ncbi:putative polysaccharide biosynthesis protein [Desulfuribacillus stibiiarsenatis]|uniref:putative polysaccharide biosynthesis protein n=1 Tax=Desulfuribacillus stibiiarsenatis TaxID=1390249 RepID=UPI000A4586AA|nr:polysaccharide biosynthesis protein [Desulfuribacillus stibiiarsenatis]
MNQKSFVKGAVILGVAALISKTMGGIYRIPYQNIVGNEGLALYNLVYPMYTTLLVVSTAGFPIAVSKFVSERLAIGDIRGAERVFRISFFLMMITGLLSFSLLFYGAETLANLTGDPGAALSIKSVSLALLLVPIIAVIRGYFQGWQEMMPTAVSQVFEQLIRVITIIVLAYMLIQVSVEYAAAGAVFGAFTGAVLSVLILGYYYIRHRKVVTYHLQRQTKSFAQEPFGELLRKLTYYALPICFGTLVLPLFNLADSYTVINVLQNSGMESLDARYMFGVYSKALPLVQISALFATSLSLALIPSISEAKSLQQEHIIKRRTSFALRLTVIVGLPAAFGLAVLAKPLNLALFNEVIGSDVIMVLSFATIFSTLEITSSGILQGIGESKLPAKNLFVGFIFKVALNLLLISYIGIMGAAIATIVAYFIALYLNLRDLRIHAKTEYRWMELAVKPLTAALIMTFFVAAVVYGMTPWMESYFSLRIAHLIVSVIGILVGLIAYGIAIIVTKTLSFEEIETVPKIGPAILRLTSRLPFLKR